MAAELEKWLTEEGDPFRGDDWNAMQVVRAFREDHPDDEDEPITEEWLRIVCQNIGGNEDENDEEFVRYYDFGPLTFYTYRSSGWVLTPNEAFEWYCPKTRGDLRSACKGFGIPLNEE